MKKYLILLISLLLLSTSCRTSYLVPLQPELEQIFLGRTYAQIVEVLGAPERTTPDGKGGQILVYEELTFRTDVSRNPWTGEPVAITNTSKGYTHLYLNSDDICYGVKSNKQKKQSKFSVGKTIGLAAGLTGGAVAAVILINALSSDDFYE